MSRRGFRVAVTDPRPKSAWLLVFVATATLAITGQLEPWALAATSAAFALSLWRRPFPFAWQTNPWFLNVLMMGITTGTTIVALDGEPSTVALAHFAAGAEAPARKALDTALAANAHYGKTLLGRIRRRVENVAGAQPGSVEEALLYAQTYGDVWTDDAKKFLEKALADRPKAEPTARAEEADAG